MLYIFTGDRMSAREAGRRVVTICKKKQPNAEYIHILGDEAIQTTEELLHSQGLFEKKLIVFIDDIDIQTIGKHLLKNSNQYVTSPHMFILFSPTMNTNSIALLKKEGATIKEYSSKKDILTTTKVFAFVELFLLGDTIKTLHTFHKLLVEGETANTLLTILQWQVRILNAVQIGETAQRSGVKPYPFKKTQTILSKLSQQTPFLLLQYIDTTVRRGRLNRLSDAEIVEFLIVSYTPNAKYIQQELTI